MSEDEQEAADDAHGATGEVRRKPCVEVLGALIMLGVFIMLGVMLGVRLDRSTAGRSRVDGFATLGCQKTIFVPTSAVAASVRASTAAIGAAKR